MFWDLFFLVGPFFRALFFGPCFYCSGFSWEPVLSWKYRLREGPKNKGPKRSAKNRPPPSFIMNRRAKKRAPTPKKLPKKNHQPPPPPQTKKAPQKNKKGPKKRGEQGKASKRGSKPHRRNAKNQPSHYITDCITLIYSEKLKLCNPLHYITRN